MKKIFIFFIFLTQIHVFGQSSVLIEPNGSNGILSVHSIGLTSNSDDTSNPPVAPTSWEGTRLMWIPSRSAFRVGSVEGDSWNSNYIGLFSFATGLNTLASGRASTSVGYSTKAIGNYSTSMGFNTTASGDYSTSIGNSTTASNYSSTSMGYHTTASGGTSTSMGYETTASGGSSTSTGENTTASGEASISMGFQTTAQAFASQVMGRYNIISGATENWIATDPLFIAGNGVNNTNRNNALTLLKNANLGLNTATPQYPLVFKDDLGDKISLYYGNSTNTTNHYGMGVQSAQFQLFTPSTNDAIVFGTGRSAAFTENIRFTGNGLVGIGINAPSELLDVNGRMRVRHKPNNTAGVWMSNSLNSTAVGDGAFYGMKSDTEAGVFIGGAWRFGVTNTGVVSASGGISVGGGETISKIKKTSVNYNIPSIPANSSINDFFTIGDLSSTDNIIVNPDGTIFPLVIAYTRYIASTVMEIVFYNPTNVAVDIPSRTFNITVIK